VSNRRFAQFAVALGLVAVLAGAAWAEDNAVTSTNVPVESNSSVLALPRHAGVPTGSTIPPGGPSSKVIALWVTVFVLGAVAIILLAYLQKRRVEAYRKAVEQEKKDALNKPSGVEPPGEDS
jgi:hypothetical protein